MPMSAGRTLTEVKAGTKSYPRRPLIVPLLVIALLPLVFKLGCNSLTRLFI